MAASYIPSGYRLLTSADIGKTFGIDLEPNFYIDNSVVVEPDTETFRLYFGGTFENAYRDSWLMNDLYFSVSSSGFTTIRLEGTPQAGKIYDSDGWDSVTYFDLSLPFTLVESTGSITCDNTWVIDNGYNNFFYVKDKVEEPEEEQNPYNIKLTEPKLTIHCEEQTMKKDIVVQVDVYDGTVEGGEVAEDEGSSGLSGRFYCGFSFTETVVTNIQEDIIIPDVNNISFTIKSYDHSGQEIECNIKTSAITYSNYSGYDPFPNGLLFEIEFDNTKVPEKFVITTNGITLKPDGVFGNGYSFVNQYGASLTIDQESNYYLLDAGSIGIDTANSFTIWLASSTDQRFFGGSYKQIMRSSTGGGADD